MRNFRQLIQSPLGKLLSAFYTAQTPVLRSDSVSYLQQALKGKNEWWRYLLSICVILFFWQLLGSIPAVILVLKIMTDDNPATDFDQATLQFSGVDPIISYLVLSFSFIALLVGLYIAVRFIHQRAFLSLVRDAERINWSRFLQGFGVYIGLMLILSLVNYLSSPDNYNFTFDAKQFFIFLPLALILTPIQASTEELLFRGYLMQTFGLASQNKWLAAIVSGILFMLPHLLNPEAKLDPVIMPFTYFWLGFFLAVVTLKDDALELAMGAHSANNLYTFLFSNYEGSAVQSPSIFTETSIDPLGSLISLLFVSAAFYVIIFYLLPKRHIA